MATSKRNYGDEHEATYQSLNAHLAAAKNLKPRTTTRRGHIAKALRCARKLDRIEREAFKAKQ